MFNIRDPQMLVDELEQLRVEYNTVRLHADIGYITPDGEHEQSGEALQEARRIAS